MAIVSDQRLGGPGMAGPAYDRIVVAAPHLVHAHASRCRWPTLEHRHHPIRIATALPQVERGRTTPELPRMLDPHNTHGAMPTRCPSYFGVGQRRVSAPACARRGTTPPSIPPGYSGPLPPTHAKVWPIPSSNRFAPYG